MPTEPEVTVKLDGRAGIISAIPGLLGFHPADSLVMVCLTGPRRRVGPVIRVDYSDYLANPDGTARQFLSIIRRLDAEVVIAHYGTHADPGDIANTIADEGVEVLDVLFLSNDQHDADPHLASEVAGTGRVIHDSRAAVNTQVEYDKQAPVGLDIGLIAAMRDNTNRDAFIAANMGNSGEALQRVLAQLRGTRDRPDDVGRAVFIADLSAVAAIFAYRNGDGATAQICLDRGLRAEPKHNLSHLLVAAISTGLDPEELDALVAAEAPPRGPLNRRRLPG